MPRQDDLIYDVGLHNGDDTAHYLQRGFRVVAIEANPVMVERGRERFADAVATQQLQILDIGIHTSQSSLTFYVSANDHWSSFDLESAGRDGTPTTAIEVRTRPFADVLTEYGVPYYLKIDIEALDEACLRDLDKVPRGDLPAYVSWEAGPRAHDAIAHMADLGYAGFKVIRQSDHRAALSEHLHPLRTRVSQGVRRRLRLPQKRGPGFPRGSSGPFGEDTDGQWKSADVTMDQWRRYAAMPLPPADWHPWFDIHARR